MAVVREREPRGKRAQDQLGVEEGWEGGSEAQRSVSQQDLGILGLKPPSSRTQLSQVRLKSFKGTGLRAGRTWDGQDSSLVTAHRLSRALWREAHEHRQCDTGPRPHYGGQRGTAWGLALAGEAATQRATSVQRRPGGGILGAHRRTLLSGVGTAPIPLTSPSLQLGVRLLPNH